MSKRIAKKRPQTHITSSIVGSWSHFQAKDCSKSSNPYQTILQCALQSLYTSYFYYLLLIDPKKLCLESPDSVLLPMLSSPRHPRHSGNRCLATRCIDHQWIEAKGFRGLLGETVRTRRMGGNCQFPRLFWGNKPEDYQIYQHLRAKWWWVTQIEQVLTTNGLHRSWLGSTASFRSAHHCKMDKTWQQQHHLSNCLIASTHTLQGYMKICCR